MIMIMIMIMIIIIIVVVVVIIIIIDSYQAIYLLYHIIFVSSHII